MHTAATDGADESTGFGLTALAHIATILPTVAEPSSVVRSIDRMARSRAHSLESRLIERLASEAARSSNPTASTAAARETNRAASFALNRTGVGWRRSISAACDIRGASWAGKAMVAESRESPVYRCGSGPNESGPNASGVRASRAPATRSRLVVSDTTSDSGPNSHRTWRQPPHGGVGRSASVTTATQSIRRSPAAIAAATAFRSAHTYTG